MKILRLGMRKTSSAGDNLAVGSLNFRLAAWLGVSIAFSLLFFLRFWPILRAMLSPDWVFGQYHAAPWGVLTLCSIWLYLKRKEIWRGMQLGQSLVFIPVGLALVVGAVLMPHSREFLVFQVIMVWLGIFAIFFGKGARIPAILLGIYGFVITFPLMVVRFVEEAYARTAIAPLMWSMTRLGYPLGSEGQWVHFTSLTGEPISVVITTACAGPSTMGVFAAIFALMMLDIPLPPRKAGWVFLIGAVGTWFQSFIRLVILMLAGYYWGEDALWTAHFWTIYGLFPVWYLIFVYIYFRQAGGRTGSIKMSAGVGRRDLIAGGKDKSQFSRFAWGLKERRG